MVGTPFNLGDKVHVKIILATFCFTYHLFYAEADLGMGEGGFCSYIDSQSIDFLKFQILTLFWW